MKKELRTIDYIIITYFILQFIYFEIFKGFVDYAVSDKEYGKMYKINHNKSVVGMTIDEVVEQLGEPRFKYNDIDKRTVYTYSAGRMFKKNPTGDFYGVEYYDFIVSFDENNRVKYTYMEHTYMD